MFKEILLNENSSLSKFGINKKQIKAIYANSYYGIAAPDSNVNFVPLRSKKEATEVLKNGDVLAGVDKNNNLLISSSTESSMNTRAKFYFKKISPDGKILERNSANSASSILDNFKFVTKYFYAPGGSIITTDIPKKEIKNSEGYKIYNNTKNYFYNEAEKIINEEIKNIKSKVSKYIDSGNYEKAKEIIDKLNYSFGDISTSKTKNEILKNALDLPNSTSYDDIYFISLGKELGYNGGGNYTISKPEIEKVIASANASDVKQASYRILKQIKNYF